MSTRPSSPDFRSLRRALACAVLAACAYVPVAAQPADTIPTTSGGVTSGANRPLSGNTSLGTLTMEVNVWGFVRNPGRLTLNSSARLLDAISAAGGPTERAKLNEVKVVHDKFVDSTHKELVVYIDLEKFEETGDPAANPVLYPGDTIILPGDSLNSFNQIVSIVSNVAVVTLSVIGLIFAFKK